MSSVSSDLLATVVGHLRKAQSVLFITGAGMSADSGLPTYRGVGGLYNGVSTEDGMPIEAALSGEMLAHRPEITWKYLLQIEQNCRQAVFNPGHSVIAAMEKQWPRVWTLTQNIDGFHSAAGSRHVVEIHGNMHRLRCDACGWNDAVENFDGLAIPPVCPSCRRIARPDVVFFGESLPAQAVDLYEDELNRGFDIYFWIGTTCVFPYIRAPLQDARKRGALAVEINPGETEISSQVDIRIPLGAACALQEIWRSCQHG